ncbi:MAG: restriction endonuclease [Dehalococcoidia bacterium]|nr:restriction endonuclease [Dehalococcoidia bacterium]
MATLGLDLALKNHGKMAAEYPAKARHSQEPAKFLEAMLRGSILEIKPQLNPQSELGFSFPTVNQLLNTSDKESVAILESLAGEGILVRKFFDKFLHCPQCGSMNLRPVYCCGKCGSGNIVRGRVLEHLVCKYAGTEEEFFLKGRLVCPKCKQELYTLGTDYRSLGVSYKCRDCGEIFNQPTINWRCLKCSSITVEGKITEVDAYSYSLNEEKRNWLQFELKPRSKLLQFIQGRGYEVRENVRVKGRSGAEHTFDLLATKDDNIVVHNIAVGIEISAQPIGLSRVFSLDDKAYDTGFYDKVLIAIPGVTPEARQFAARQRIRVLESADLEAFLARDIFPAPLPEVEVEMERKPFQFKSKSELVSCLRSRGYKVKEGARVTGRSEAEHTVDILATRDDGIMVHNIIIGVEVSDKPIGIDKVFDFDDKAYDTGIHDKILVAVPGLSREAMRFARRQRIKVFEAETLEPE